MKYVSSCFFIQARGNDEIAASFAEYGQILPALLPAAPHLLPYILPDYPADTVIQLLLVSGKRCYPGKSQQRVKSQLSRENPLPP